MNEPRPEHILSGFADPSPGLARLPAGRPVALFLHGWATGPRTMALVADALGDTVTSLFYELPGHGGAPEDPAGNDLDALTAQVVRILGQLPTTAPRLVVGWSLGGMLALRAIASDPGLADGLVLAAPVVRMASGEDFDAGIAPAVLRAMVREFRRDPGGVLEAFGTRSFSNEDEKSVYHPEAARRLNESLKRGSKNAKLRLLIALMNVDIRQSIEGIYTPMTLIHGSRDAIVPVRSSAQIHAACPRTGLAEVPGAGHALPLMHPKKVANCVVQLLSEL